MSVVCLIPARGGSKGIPGKNLRLVAGVSLVGRAVLAAQRFLEEIGGEGVVLVDTDSEAIAAEGRAWGASVPFLRAPELAEDDTPTVLSTLAALERLEQTGIDPSVVMLLQPTSPLRTEREILACWEQFDCTTAPSVNAVTPVEHGVDLALRLDEEGCLHWRNPAAGGVRRRQDLETAYRLTGAVYISSVSTLRAHQAFTVPGLSRGVVIPPERAVDVDTPEDLAVADALAGDVGSPVLRLGEFEIGGGAPCFIIAEAGVNHNGDAELAHRLVDVAADAGADCVKFQIFDPERLVSSAAQKAEYQVTNTGTEESQLEMLRSLTLPLEVFRSLAEHARERGILFLATAFDEGSADFLEELGVSAFKVPSGELTNDLFLAYLAAKGKPLLISTGMATMPEVAGALGTVRRNGSPPVALFHCVTSYPAAPESCNLRAMDTMRAAFRVPTGWSDHTAGIAVSLAAAAYGAELLEKHFTLDRFLPGPDHAASLEPEELTALVRGIREAEAARGDGVKRPTEAELRIAPVVRRSLHAARDLAAGEVLRTEDVVALRPGTGIPPGERFRVIGRPLRRALRCGEILTWDELS